jgi:hypothetical protein
MKLKELIGVLVEWERKGHGDTEVVVPQGDDWDKYTMPVSYVDLNLGVREENEPDTIVIEV